MFVIVQKWPSAILNYNWGVFFFYYSGFPSQMTISFSKFTIKLFSSVVPETYPPDPKLTGCNMFCVSPSVGTWAVIINK